MLIKAKFAGKCAVCDKSIVVGSSIEYTKDVPVRHADCQPIEIPETAIYLSGGSGYGYKGWHIGEVILEKGEFFKVIQASSKYYRDGDEAMSFGVGDESGYFYSARAIPATEEEAAPLKAAMAEKQKIKDAERLRRAISAEIKEKGIFAPKNSYPEGEFITNRQTIYGGGDWFVIGNDKVWYVLNNGHDGDDWSANNIGTGGAGALGWYVPKTEDILGKLLEMEEVLEPQAIINRKEKQAGTVSHRIFSQYCAPYIDVNIWAQPNGDYRQPNKQIAWVSLNDKVLAGINGKGEIFLGVIGISKEVYNHTIENAGYLLGDYAVMFEFSSTPARLAAITNLLPDWAADPTFLQLVLRNMFSNQNTFDAKDWANVPSGKVGRYKLYRNKGWADSAKEAIRMSGIDGCPLNKVEFNEADLLHVHQLGSMYSDGQWQLWSDGPTKGYFHGEARTSLSSAASELISSAIRQDIWKADKKWRELLDIKEVKEVSRLAHTDGRNEERTLEELIALTDSGTRTLYKVTVNWWYLGEDGDAGTDSYIFESKEAAKNQFAGKSA